MKLTFSFVALALLLGICHAVSLSRSKMSALANAKSHKRSLGSVFARQGGGKGQGGSGNEGGNAGGNKGGNAGGNCCCCDKEKEDDEKKCDNVDAKIAYGIVEDMLDKCNSYAGRLMEENGIEDYNDQTKAQVHQIWVSEGSNEDRLQLLYSVCPTLWETADQYEAADEEGKKAIEKDFADHFLIVLCSSYVADREEMKRNGYLSEGAEALHGAVDECKTVFGAYDVMIYKMIEEAQQAGDAAGADKRDYSALLRQLKQLVSKK